MKAIEQPVQVPVETPAISTFQELLEAAKPGTKFKTTLTIDGVKQHPVDVHCVETLFSQLDNTPYQKKFTIFSHGVAIHTAVAVKVSHKWVPSVLGA